MHQGFYIVTLCLWLSCVVYFGHRNEERQNYPVLYPVFKNYQRLEKTAQRDKFMVSFLVYTAPMLFGLTSLVAYWTELSGTWRVVAVTYVVWWIGITIAWCTRVYRGWGDKITPHQINTVAALSMFFGVWLVPYIFYKLASITTNEVSSEQVTEDAELAQQTK